MHRPSAFFRTLAGLALAAACGGRSRYSVDGGEGAEAGGGSGGTTGGSAMGGSAVGGSAVGGSAVGGSAVGGSAVGGSAMGGSTMGGSAGRTASGGSAMGGGSGGTASSGVGGAFGGGGNGGDSGDGAGGAPEPPDTLVPILADGPWNIEQRTTGIAVDSKGVIFLSDAEHVFRVEGTTVSIHMDLADVAAETGQGDLAFQDLDIAADDTLYIAAGGLLLRSDSDAPRTLHLWNDFDEDATAESRAQVGVITPGRAIVVDDEGMKEITDDGVVERYGVTELARIAGCATEDLASAPSGVFLYQPGCDESPLLRGEASGLGVDILYKAGLIGKKPISASNFVCSARDPAGGFYVVTRQDTGFAPILYHVDENATPSDDARYVPTTPSLADQQMVVSNDPLAFYFCSMAVAPDRSIVFQTYSQLWRINPQP